MAEQQPSLSIARRLIDAQCPQWRALELSAVSSAGTDNALFRLGCDWVVRLPTVARAAEHASKEARWLPTFQGELPLKVPVPEFLGRASEAFDRAWSVVPWIKGQDLRAAVDLNLVDVATRLGECLGAVHGLPTEGAPPAGEQNNGRGLPLATRDHWVQQAIEALDNQALIEPAPVLDLWQRCLDCPTSSREPRWVHGDPNAGNLIASDGKLAALIDWGLMGVGDPAVDLLAGWYLFDADARPVFRSTMGIDDGVWLRGAGWALSMALIAWPYYLDRNPTVTAESELVVARLLADFG